MRLPKEISPCPIAQAIVELRFVSSPEVPADAIFGLAFGSLSKKYPSVTNLPILQLPEQMREADPNLRYQAHHRFTRENLSISLGPHVFVFSCASPYVGWDKFFSWMKEDLEPILKIDGLVEDFERLGVRFINFFDGPAIESIAMSVEANKLPMKECQFHATFVYPEDEFTSIVQIANKADVSIDNKVKNGSVIDIDTHRQSILGEIKKDLWGYIDRAHLCEKKIFYALLKQEALDKLNPIY